MRLILQDGFWVVQIPLFRLVKLKFLVHFPVDHFPHSDVSSLILLLYQLATFAYNEINYHFIIIALLIASFSHKGWLVIFHRRFADRILSLLSIFEPILTMSG